MKERIVNDTCVCLQEEGDRILIRAGAFFDGFRMREGADLIVANGAIEAVTDPGSFDWESFSPDKRFDLRRRFLMPGLIESHIHLSGMQTSDPYRRYFEAETTRFLRGLRHAEELLSRGFTTVKDMGGKGKGVELNDAGRKGLFTGPRILSAHESITPTNGHFDWTLLPYGFVRDSRLRGVIADGTEACRLAVRTVLREGADFIKICTSATPVQFSDVDGRLKPCYSVDEIRAVCDEAHSGGKHVCSHAVDHIGIENAIVGGVDVIEHCFHDFERYPRVLELLSENRVAIVPTLSLLRWKAEMQFAKGDEAGGRDFEALFQRHLRFVKVAHDAGVRMACGTDENGLYGIGRNAEELLYMRDAGIADASVLQCATAQAAQIHGIGESIGSISPGKSADLLVWRTDLAKDFSALKEKANIELVFLSQD